MEKVKVLVANQPRLMRELVLATISDQPDIEIVGEIQDDSRVFESVDRTAPDFLIVALENLDRRPPFCDSLLERHPGLRILALAADTNVSICYWAATVIHSVPLEASQQGVLQALRSKSYAAGGSA